jgi:SnoaL-like domain
VLGHQQVGSDGLAPLLLPHAQNLAYRYALAIDSKNVDLVSSLFSDRSSFGHWGAGPAGAKAYYSEIWHRFRRSRHFVSNVVVTSIDEQNARGIVYCHSEQEYPAGWTSRPLVYFDDYAIGDSGWTFVSRKVRTWEKSEPDAKGRQPVPLPEAWDTWTEFHRET